MAYTLDQFAADCRAALLKDAGRAGRERVREFTVKACADRDFITRHLGLDVDAERTVLYEDPDRDVCILGRGYKGAKSSAPHDHGPSWAIYGQASGETEMTDCRLVEKPTDGKPGKVAKVRTYKMTPGMAHLYGEGDLHSPRREAETRLIRTEGIDLTKVKRDKYEPVEGGWMFPRERIICLTEETVETLYLLGEESRIVGISGYVVRPPRARREKPRVSAARRGPISPRTACRYRDLQAARRRY